MDACLRTIGCLCCFGMPQYDDEKRPLWLSHQNNDQPHLMSPGTYSDDELDNIPVTAARIVALLQTATSRSAVDADEHVQNVRERLERGELESAWNPQWKQNLGEAVLERLVEIVRPLLESATDHIEHPQETLLDIVQWAREVAAEVFEWTEEHPRLTMCLALAVAVAAVWVLAPWVLEAVGFGELGPIADSVAARLQMRYMGLVPKGSWFSFFQRLGMVWKK